MEETEEQIQLNQQHQPQQESGTEIPQLKSSKTQFTHGKHRLSLIFPEQPAADEFCSIDDEERFLYEARSWPRRDEEFNLDKLQKEQMRLYKGDWSWGIFLEFLVYHVLYMIVMGPLMVVLFAYKPGLTLMRNMKFYGFSPAFLTQTSLWASQAIGGIGYFLWSDSVITLTEVIFLWYGMTVRCVVIAAKYATLGDNIIEIYKKQVLKDEVFNFDLMMGDWRLQTPKILFLEPYRSLKRYQFELSLFKLDFIVPLHHDTHQKVINTKIEYFADMNIQLEPNQYSGFNIFGYLVGEFQARNSPSSHFYYSLIESALMSLTPILLRVDQFYSNPPSNFDTLRLVLNASVLTFSIWGTNIFFHQAVYDFNRKFFLLEQCLYMIKVVPEKYSSPKLLPTVNFNNPQSLQAWSMLRALCFDYGQAYNLRTQGFYSLCFLGFIAFLVLALAYILEFVTFTKFELILLSEFALLLIAFTSYYLYLGAYLNQYNEQCEIALQDLKSVYLDLMRMKDFYISEKVVPQNYIHKRFKVLLCQQDKKDIENQVELLITQIVAELDDNIRIIHFDERNNPFKLYGVKVTFNLLKSAVVGLSTVFSYAVQQTMMK